MTNGGRQMALFESGSPALEKLLLSQLSRQKIKQFVGYYAQPYKELMAYYRCAMMSVETKFNVLNEELSLQYDRNPIETVKTRLKTPESVLEKTSRKGFPLTVDSIEENINDIAGVRVITSFVSDIYTLRDAFLKQDDIRLIEKKDYIKEPKSNGYRSLHLIVEIPIFLHNEKKTMKVEVQFRTTAMDWWATVEHKLRYKKDYGISEQMERELYECAEIGADLDRRMEELRKSAEEYISWN